ncbi:EAL domain-containing protein [Escherichia coli]
MSSWKIASTTTVITSDYSGGSDFQSRRKHPQKLRLGGCRIVLSQVGRDLQIFNSVKANMADYLLLDGELCANVQGNLMDEMLITIIQGHAQRLGMKTIAGPVVLPLVMDTLSGIGVDLIYGEVIADAQPLDLLVNSSYFAINLRERLPIA